MKALPNTTRQRGDGRALALVGIVMGLVAALCVVLFEISRGWWGDDGRGAAGWAATVFMLATMLFAEYWLLLAVFRATGLKFNNRRLEPKPPLAWQRFVANALLACVVALAVLILFHQAIPILPFRSEILLAALAGSGGMLEFIDLKANRAYWLQELEQANQDRQPQA